MGIVLYQNVLVMGLGSFFKRKSSNLEIGRTPGPESVRSASCATTGTGGCIGPSAPALLWQPWFSLFPPFRLFRNGSDGRRKRRKEMGQRLGEDAWIVALDWMSRLSHLSEAPAGEAGGQL